MIGDDVEVAAVQCAMCNDGGARWVEMAAVRQRQHHRPFRLREPTGLLC